ncbi:MAG: BatD family protein [Verrucomicrobiota bacterium]
MERLSRHLLLVLCALWLIPVAQAASPSVTAVLSDSEAVVGQTVQLQIEVSGGGRGRPPAQVSVDGLQIRYTGESTQMTMRNFSTSYSVTYNYTILPERTGRFVIPPQTIDIGVSKLRTPELALNVTGSGGRGAGGRSGGPGQPAQDERLAFAEIVVPKQTAHVGEAVPIVVRIAFNARIPTQAVEEKPEIAAQGFTLQTFERRRQGQENINGQVYNVLTYKAAITPTRAGKLDLGPAQIHAAMAIPRQRGGGRSPFDLFNDPFFRDPFGAISETQEITVKSQPVTLEVKPLPTGAPSSFTGAVGTFTLGVEANPKHVQLGDPVTVKATVSGRGSFDRVSAPVLSDEQGWHKYPASGNFKKDDEVGISGSKTFEMVVSPNEKKTALPPLLFSFFDPLKEKYTTLQSPAILLAVEGGSVLATTAPPANSSSNSATPARAAPANDLLPQLNTLSRGGESFAPLFLRRDFWLLQLLPLALVLALAAWQWRRARRADLRAGRRAQWQREADELVRKLRRGQPGEPDYFGSASRVVQLRTAMKADCEPGTVDAESATRVFSLDQEHAVRLRELFAANDELRYSGSGNGAGRAVTINREAMMETIERLRS